MTNILVVLERNIHFQERTLTEELCFVAISDVIDTRDVMPHDRPGLLN